MQNSYKASQFDDGRNECKLDRMRKVNNVNVENKRKLEMRSNNLWLIEKSTENEFFLNVYFEIDERNNNKKRCAFVRESLSNT